MQIDTAGLGRMDVDMARRLAVKRKSFEGQGRAIEAKAPKL
jgi:hypothetical protein